MTTPNSLPSGSAVFREQRQPGGLQVWAHPFTCLRVPKMFNLRMDPFERADVSSNQYYARRRTFTIDQMKKAMEDRLRQSQQE
jgi:hypothetical protein